jgi:hypothetical protein
MRHNYPPLIQDPGKSSISLRLVRSKWTHEYDPTVQDSYSVTRIVDGRTYHLNLTGMSLLAAPMPQFHFHLRMRISTATFNPPPPSPAFYFYFIPNISPRRHRRTRRIPRTLGSLQPRSRRLPSGLRHHRSRILNSPRLFQRPSRDGIRRANAQAKCSTAY